uniref:Uncharacterized protein n=1 Tax=Arundo donax TaxID=35708 RepID=A0A0A9HA29_ARUDO
MKLEEPFFQNSGNLELIYPMS